MTTTELTRHEIDVKDIEYIKHGNKPLLARVYRPRETGSFPLIIDLHGGAWCKKDRTSDVATDEALARSGVVVASLDFRMPPEAGYPASLADINYAIRWFKARAAEFGVRADRVGILGVSSGGHQAMLAAMRPNDPRYAALALPSAAAVDATVRCVVLCWPVIDPLGRYHHAKKVLQTAAAKQAEEWISCHDQYWADGEAAMAEGNPTLALERGEQVPLPPVLYLQGTADPAHPRPNLDRFVASYRKAGGRVDLHLFEGMSQAFISEQPSAPASLDAIDKIIEFVHREMR
ncbi:MAG TPA: alpha/beta hydrolase [Burkholderiales bacterium]|jgi:acetyl esterase/lipase|nr:alpha/beta hydrolase [Burkholderiales bacterium]